MRVTDSVLDSLHSRDPGPGPQRLTYPNRHPQMWCYGHGYGDVGTVLRYTSCMIGCGGVATKRTLTRTRTGETKERRHFRFRDRLRVVQGSAPLPALPAGPHREWLNGTMRSVKKRRRLEHLAVKGRGSRRTYSSIAHRSCTHSLCTRLRLPIGSKPSRKRMSCLWRLERGAR